MRIKFNRDLKVERLNFLHLLFINILQTHWPKSQVKGTVIFPSPESDCIANSFIHSIIQSFRKYVLNIYSVLGTVLITEMQ